MGVFSGLSCRVGLTYVDEYIAILWLSHNSQQAEEWFLTKT